MGKKTKNLSLVLVPWLLAACGTEVPDQQRDVYTKMEDCVADWGKPELCAQIAEAEAKQFAQATTGSSHSGGSSLIFWGPSYYPGDRAVSYNGQSYAPTNNRAMSKPFAIRSTSSAVAKASPATPSRGSAATSSGSTASRGGFGHSGSSAGHSSGG
jgi:uncharacterized protein YgiB involved in biofilm formation